MRLVLQNASGELFVGLVVPAACDRSLRVKVFRGLVVGTFSPLVCADLETEAGW